MTFIWVTPQAQHLRTLLEDKFGSQITRFYVYNRRFIAGTSKWSDHAWGDALDIMVPTLDVGDMINAWLEGRTDVRYKLWRVPAHFDHIHVSMGPRRGYGTPPLSSDPGKYPLRVKHPSGSITGSWTTEENMVGLGDSGKHVEWIQRQLKALGLYSTGTVDGDYGAKTAAAVKAFQRRPAQRLPETGVWDIVTAAAMSERLGATAFAPKRHEHDDYALSHTHVIEDVPHVHPHVHEIEAFSSPTGPVQPT